jgi:hypothetical protein
VEDEHMTTDARLKSALNRLRWAVHLWGALQAALLVAALVQN